MAHLPSTTSLPVTTASLRGTDPLLDWTASCFLYMKAGSSFLAARSHFLCLSDASLFRFSPGFPVFWNILLSADVLLFLVSKLQK